MHHLNYQHLLYFLTTAREGNLTRASKQLRLSPSTVSAQIRLLEDQLGHTLFDRSHRRMVLTPRGEVVARFAEQIFAMGEELTHAMEQSSAEMTWSVRVGVESHLPKLVAANLLRSVIRSGLTTRLVVSEGLPAELAHQLTEGSLDVVLTDIPIADDGNALLQRRLGETEVVWVGAPALVGPLRGNFPQSLHGAPVMLPDRQSSLRIGLDDWLATHDVTPHVVAEIGDSALMKALGADGLAVFPVPLLVIDRVVQQYDVEVLGTAEGIRQKFYALADPRHSSIWNEIEPFVVID